MTKEKTARLIPNAIQLCTDNEKVAAQQLCFKYTQQSKNIFLFRNTFRAVVPANQSCTLKQNV